MMLMLMYSTKAVMKVYGNFGRMMHLLLRIGMEYLTMIHISGHYLQDGKTNDE